MSSFVFFGLGGVGLGGVGGVWGGGGLGRVREERVGEWRGEEGGEKRREGELIRMAGFVSAPSA